MQSGITCHRLNKTVKNFTKRIQFMCESLSIDIDRLICVRDRVPGDNDAVNAVKSRCDSWSTGLNCSDPCVVASLLKLWYRELHEPLIPYEFYEKCVNNHDNVDAALDIITQLPQLNCNVLKYFIRFLQVLIISTQNKCSCNCDIRLQCHFLSRLVNWQPLIYKPVESICVFFHLLEPSFS